MKNRHLFSFLFSTLALSASAPAWAVGGGCTPAPSTLGRPRAFVISHFTNYEPSRGGINGQCGHSSTRGIDPCNYFIDDQIRGNRAAAVVAVPQRGPASHLFGGVYRLSPLEQRGVKPVSGCTLGMAADHYGTSSNHLSKMDVVSRAYSPLSGAINSSSGQIVLVGAIEEFRAAHGTRRIQRKVGAY